MRPRAAGPLTATLVALLTLLLAPQGAAARVFVANPSLGDPEISSNPCTEPCPLRQAIFDASGSEEGEATVEVPPGNYLLSHGPVRVEPALGMTETIVGRGARASEAVISGGGKSQVMIVGDEDGAGATFLEGVEITRGQSLGEGAGIRVERSSPLTLLDVAVEDNVSERAGGGIYTRGRLSVNESLIADNTAAGEDATGGGLASTAQAPVAITNSTIAHNTATSEGGGIDNGGQLELVNATIAGNQTEGVGGGVADQPLRAVNSILARNDPEDCSAEILDSHGHNLADDASCHLTGPGDLEAPAQLTERFGSPLLAGNGGATETIALTPTSPALRAADEPACPPLDQRGVQRPKNACDIGAFQLSTHPLPHVSSIEPASGPTAGGTEVRIEGSAFLKGSKVDIGEEATQVNVLSETEITARTAAGTAGGDEVVVSDAVGSSSGGPSYTYLSPGSPPPPPHVSSIEPASGSTAGGSEVTIRGSGFTADAKVLIGDEATSLAVRSGTEITAVTAAHATGTEEVVVSEANGQSTGGPAYTFVAADSAGGGGSGGSNGSSGGSGGGSATPSPLGSPGPGVGVLGVAASALPAPVLARSFDVTPAGGVVFVELPGQHTFVPLTEVEQIPVGSIVDTTNGVVAITSASAHGGTQKGQFFGGEFVLTQGANGLVVAILTGGDFSVCPTARERSHQARVSSRHASGNHVVRKLWANAHGSFATKGNYAAGAVAGTEWLTEDLCDGTLIRVTRDKVLVTNLVNQRRFLVKAGHRRLARAPVR